MKHSPGPWTWERRDGDDRGYVRLTSVDGLDVLYPWDSWVQVDSPADARLIAAAPELLEALRVVADQAFSAWETEVVNLLSLLARIEGKE